MPRLAVTNRAALPKPTGYFVYCYLRTNSLRPYYVGKGSRRDRLTARHSIKVPKDWSRIRILRDGLATDAEALEWERFYVEKLGRKLYGGCLLNKKEGGEKGGDQDPEVLARISAGVKARHAEGAFHKLNSPETTKRRAYARAANKAAEYGIPEDVYIAMPMSKRDQCKQWLAANPGATYEEWLASRKSAAAAAKYGLTESEWLDLDGKQRNCLKEWMNRWPGRSPHDWLAGVRAKKGTAPRIDKVEVLRLVGKGVRQSEIAKLFSCHLSTINRIVNGKRQASAA
jgi:hypothetical protein